MRTDAEYLTDCPSCGMLGLKGKSHTCFAVGGEAVTFAALKQLEAEIAGLREALERIRDGRPSSWQGRMAHAALKGGGDETITSQENP